MYPILNEVKCVFIKIKMGHDTTNIDMNDMNGWWNYIET